ncbi:uncharacterized protein LOC142353103 isoform X1 [Convolutriloba macropyga]|uniref:uncharacterized protein LOC142353103 isoform X1 n=1 Tax=Convolutriloba macropyga TaxID=536237 RepID=UPI003F51C355
MYKSYEYLLAEAHNIIRPIETNVKHKFCLNLSSKSVNDYNFYLRKPYTDSRQLPLRVEEIHLRVLPPKNGSATQGGTVDFSIVASSSTTGLHIFDTNGNIIYEVFQIDKKEKHSLRPKFLSSFTNSFLLFDTWTENFFITSINDESHKIAKYKLDLPTACIKTRDISCVGIEQSNVLIGRRSHIFLFDIKSGEFKRGINLGNIDFVQSATGCRAGIVISGTSSLSSGTIIRCYDYLFMPKWELSHREHRSLICQDISQLCYVDETDQLFALLKISMKVLVVEKNGLISGKIDVPQTFRDLGGLYYFNAQSKYERLFISFCNVDGYAEIHEINRDEIYGSFDMLIEGSDFIMC